MKKVGSGSELRSESVEKELEAEAFFRNQALPDFQTGYNRWVKRNNNNFMFWYITM